MRTIVQRYAGWNETNCPVWIDTRFETLDRAREKHPEYEYREVGIVAAEQPGVRIFPATTDSIGIAPCGANTCKKHQTVSDDPVIKVCRHCKQPVYANEGFTSGYSHSWSLEKGASYLEGLSISCEHNCLGVAEL